MSYDFSTAEQARDFDTIPAKAIVPVVLHIQPGDSGPENVFKISESGLHMMSLELTITEGEFAKRKIWHRLFMGGGSTEGHQRAIEISKSLVRAILEAARGVAPSDESPEAMAKRKLSRLRDMDGMEFWIEVGVEKGKDGYADKNKIARVIPHGAAKAPTSPAQQPALFGGSPKSAVASSPPKTPSWAQ